MNWVQRKIYLYNVTFGLYMLDWWERLLFKFKEDYMQHLSCLYSMGGIISASCTEFTPNPAALRPYNSKLEFLWFGNLNDSRCGGACVNVVCLPERGSSYIGDLQKLSVTLPVAGASNLIII